MKTAYCQVRRLKKTRISRLSYFIAVQVALLSGTSFGVQARDYFNPELLTIDSPTAYQGGVDLSVFENDDSQAPGTYRVDIYLNNEMQDTRDVEFKLVKTADDKSHLQPCLSVADLAAMGVRTDTFPALGDAKAQCANLAAIPQASAEFSFSSQRLVLSIPQAAVSQKARGYVPESQWNEGIPAFLLNYSASGGNNYVTNGSNGNSQFVNLRPGINIGPWRLRNYSTWSRSSGAQDKWDTVYTYAKRDIISLKSQLTLGDSSSPSDVFDSVPFRGGQLASDDDMMPDSQKGYAPVVRGIARSNAQVTIRQNGYVIYQSYVSPGAFEINDMYPTGGSGDLLVTIKEADGSEQHLVVPFASLPVLQREGRFKYSVTSGEYRSYDSRVEKTVFGQGTAIYGLPYGFTAFGGGQFADHYQSLAAGVGKNLGDFGAISTDVTQAWSSKEDSEQEKGQSWRIRYSKNLIGTGTNFAIAGYRYSTSGYYSLQEVLDTYGTGLTLPLTERRRNRTEMTMTQRLGDIAGSMSLNLINEDYWNSNRHLRSMGVGYNNSWHGISYGLNYSYSRNSLSNDSEGASGRVYDKDQIFAFNVSVPLDRWLSNSYASYNVSTSKQSGTTNTVGLSGTSLADNNLSWSAQQNFRNQGVGSGGTLNTDYKGTYGEVGAGYSYDKSGQRVNYSLQGGVIAHRNGITLGQPMGETVVLVKAPGADGVGILNHTGVKTDYRGYAIVPYSTPYRKNALSLNTETLPNDVDLELTTQTVVPTRGAVVRAEYVANVGQRVLMTLLRQGGGMVPFGATVSDPAQKTTQEFIVGDSGQVYLTGLAESGRLNVKWGNGADQQCQVNFTLPKQTTASTAVQTLNNTCQ